ncbi:MAG TPA: cell division ATP-binding protein FtsE [Bacillota bacterium]|nr:MAG: Cell division ATP-binding protein FtsE [Firmicutes bacterium ADurb.Bin153]HNV34797.1 cell division ATP-binding protein FtsE [Bacillota bacterium]
MIQLKGVGKIFSNNVVALSGVDLEIKRGDFVFLVGPSGAGKSTLLSLLYRGVKPTRGDVVVNGVDVKTLRHHEVCSFRRKLGVIFQDFKLLPDRNVYSNVSFALEVIEAPPKDLSRRVGKALDLVGLTTKAKARPNQLSGGEQQRVAIARAIVNDPILVLADEPTGNLDPETSRDIMELLSDINELGSTVVCATHNKSIVDEMRRRVIEMEHGKIIRDERRGVYSFEGPFY